MARSCAALSNPRIRRPAISCVRHGTQAVLPRACRCRVSSAPSSYSRGRSLNGYGPYASKSRKWFGGSSVKPALRHRSGSMERSTMNARFASKNGRSGSGRMSIARATMNLWASNPHALRGRRSEKNRRQQAKSRQSAYLIIAECLASAPTCRSRAVCRSPSPAHRFTAARRCRSSARTPASGAPGRCPPAEIAAFRQAAQEDRHLAHRRARQLPDQSRDDERGAARAVDRRARRGSRSRRSAGIARRRSASRRPDDGAGRPGALAHLERARAGAEGAAARQDDDSARAHGRPGQHDGVDVRGDRRDARRRRSTADASACASTPATCSPRATTCAPRTAIARRSTRSKRSSASIA